MASSNLPSTEDIEKIYKVCTVVISNVKTKYPDWQKKALPMIAFALIAVLGAVATLIYYIMTRKIVPLIIYMYCAIPILAYGLAQASKSLESLYKEFTEYSEANAKLLDILSETSCEDADNLTKGLAAAICAATTVMSDKVDQVTLGDLKGLPEYQSALVLATRLSNISTAISNVKAEQSDVENVLSGLDLEETAQVATAASDVAEAYQSQKGQSVDTDKTTKTASTENELSQTSESAELSAGNTEENPHIITVKDDDIHEDLTIVV